MRIGIISIIVALIGISFVFWFNYQTYELFIIELQEFKSNSEMRPLIITNGKLNKLIALGIGFLGLILGIKSLRNKNRIGIIGVLLSIFLIILTFVPIWNYIISDSALDINFNN